MNSNSESNEVYDPEVSRWWSTSIIDMAPGKIEFRGVPVEQLMGSVSFAEMIWFMIFGSRISQAQRELFEVALVMSVDHGPQAPSIAISRMAATCGVGINNVMASAINTLGDNHGGAGEQCSRLFYEIRDLIDGGEEIRNAVESALARYSAEQGKVIPGYGHRFHKPVDPRAPRTLQLVSDYADSNNASRIFIEIAEEVERQINEGKHNRIPLNVDGASALIFCQLGVPPTLARGLFCLSRSVGILAHAWEQLQQGGKNKGPMPKKYLPEYVQTTEARSGR